MLVNLGEPVQTNLSVISTQFSKLEYYMVKYMFSTYDLIYSYH